MAVVDTVMIFVHVLSAIILVGGLHYAAIAVLPAVRAAEGDGAREILKGIHRRFRKLAAVSIGLLLLSGLHLMGTRMKLGIMESPTLWLFLGKVVCALGVFGIVLILAYGPRGDAHGSPCCI